MNPCRTLPAAALVVAATMATGCSDKCDSCGPDPFGIGLPEGGVSAATFQSLADYHAHPTVGLILQNMPREPGTSPPDIAGTYDYLGEVVATTFPGNLVGDLVSGQFAFGRRTGDRLDLGVSDRFARDVGAASVIEGTADRFTVYTAFVILDDPDDAAACEFHVVNVYTGRRRADGRLVDLNIGQGIVGLTGSCQPFLVGDIEISIGDAPQIAVPGEVIPGNEPTDPSRVLIVFENFLLNPLDVIVNLDTDPGAPFVTVDPVGSLGFEADPGFHLTSASVQPVGGTDTGGNPLFMGESVVAFFPPDSTGAGATVFYSMTNEVGSDIFFAPLPVNCTPNDIFSVVNTGIEIPGYEDIGGGGFDCFCAIEPAAVCLPENAVNVGYYSYSRPGIIAPSEVSVRFFRLPTETEILPRFQGPFVLEPDTGGVVLEVVEPGAIP